MFGIPRRFSHFIFAVIQAGLTCLIAAGVASLPFVTIRQAGAADAAEDRLQLTRRWSFTLLGQSSDDCGRTLASPLP